MTGQERGIESGDLFQALPDPDPVRSLAPVSDVVAAIPVDGAAPHQIETMPAVPPQLERPVQAELPPEAPPPGIPAEFFEGCEDGPDLATVVAEMSALKQEVKLQARTFKKLHEALQAFAGDAETGAAPPFLIKLAGALSQAVDAGFQRGVEAAADMLDERRLEAGAELDEAREEGFMHAAEALMDARDRLAFGLERAREELAAFTGWRASLGGRAVLRSALAGQELAVARLDDELKKMRFEPLARAGDVFDAERMRAVEAVTSPRETAGTVLAVLRQGYARDERTLRLADVRVAKA